MGYFISKWVILYQKWVILYQKWVILYQNELFYIKMSYFISKLVILCQNCLFCQVILYQNWLKLVTLYQNKIGYFVSKWVNLYQISK